jgi:hypothetical protein
LRWIAVAAGVALIALAFAAGSRVADTREGLIAEVVTLFAGLCGISLFLWGVLAGQRAAPQTQRPPMARGGRAAATRPVTELLLGTCGLLVAVVLMTGLAVSGGLEWAALGSVLLVPMVAGCVYLCVRFARAPSRDWKLALRRTRPPKES